MVHLVDPEVASASAIRLNLMNVVKWQRVRFTIATALASAGFCFFAYEQFRSTQNPPDTGTLVTPTAPTLSANPIKALGRLEPDGEIARVYAPSSLGKARVSQLFIKPGSQVQAGQLIAVMDGEKRLQRSVRQAEARVREARSRLSQVQAGAKPSELLPIQSTVTRLEADLQQAEHDQLRFATLYEEGAISASQLESKDLVVKTTRHQLEQAQATLKSLSEVRPADLQQADAQVEVSIVDLQDAEAELDAAYIRAPITAQVLKIHTRPGETVGDKGIAELGNANQFFATAEVYDTDLAQVRPGQPAILTSDFLTKPLRGTVEAIGLEVRKSSTSLANGKTPNIVEVRIRLNDSLNITNISNRQVNVVIQPIAQTPP
jgi:HlyD family secretion protein